MYYTESFCLVNHHVTKSRNFPYVHPIQDDIKKFDLYSPMIAKKFHDNHTIKKYSKYRSMEQRPKKLLEQVGDVIRLKHYSYKTEKSYINWIKR